MRGRSADVGRHPATGGGQPAIAAADRGLKDYAEWRPTAGTTVDIYQYVPPARPDAERPGVTVHHLYLRRTEILTETVTR